MQNLPISDKIHPTTLLHSHIVELWKTVSLANPKGGVAIHSIQDKFSIILQFLK